MRAGADSVPRATQRLQFHSGFSFDAARQQVPYFARLGISHLYASPILGARAGSGHGYDVVDPGTVNAELGGEEGLRRLVTELRRHGMGLIVDIVPNHMAVGNHDNAWWLDVLRWGRASRYANFFDIDWDVPDPALHGRVLAPFLGKPYGQALADGEIRLCFDPAAGSFHAAYFEHHFPIAPESYAAMLRAGGERLVPLGQLFQRFRGGRANRLQEFEQACRQLAEASLRDSGSAVAAVLELHSADNAAGQRQLHRLLERQHYRLAWWQTAAEEINWRRFFDIIDLAGLRVQDRAVFEAVHGTVFRLYTEGLVDGLRVDHVDGLADPRLYCRRLRQRLRKLTAGRPSGAPRGEPYLVVEKILAPGEALAADWQTDGTSGYVFMNQAGALLHDAGGEAPLRRTWIERSGRSIEFAAEQRLARRRMLHELLPADFNACAHALHALARQEPRTRDWPVGAIRRVLTELLVHFPVYRTYVDARGRSEADAHIMRQAIASARPGCRRPELPLLDLVEGWLGAMAPKQAPAAERGGRLRAIARFQQLTSPLAAKAVEDTAFYRHGTLLSRNEVGADPAQFSIGTEQFHAACAERFERYPAAMLATATHDHKRGEDLRARLAVLSEIPEQWGEAVRRWAALAAPLKPQVDGTSGPDSTDEYMLYQMIVGAWPLALRPEQAVELEEFRQRLQGWQRKAVREAKRHSGWIEPNLAYEEACDRFLQRLLDPGQALAAELAAFAGSIAAAGAVNGLSQTLLRLTTPGVPDLYQGCEWWDFSLVDPDNRRPVDFAARGAALPERPDAELLLNWRNGRVKQVLIRMLLGHRTRRPHLFAAGRYLPLEVQGPAANHLLAFARVLDEEEALLVVAPRLPYRLLSRDDALRLEAQPLADTRIVLPPPLASRRYTSLLGGNTVDTGGRLAAADLLDPWPLAALSAGTTA